jgi:hypothetical protein
MKNRSTEKFFTEKEKEIDERIKELSPLGKTSDSDHCLTRQSTNGWTPLHVAVLADNRAGMVFLLSKGILTNQQDNSKKTAADYCRELNRPELLSLLESYKPKPSSLSLSDVLSTVFDEWHVSEPKEQHHFPPKCHDFNIEVEELLFAFDKRELSEEETDFKVNLEHFISNMQQISALEGFTLHLTTALYWPRDHFIPLANGQYALPSRSENIMKAISKREFYSLIKQNKSEFATNQSQFIGSIGSADMRQNFPIKDIQDLCWPTSTANILPFYIEGGNYYLATNRFGETKLLLGEDLLPIAHYQMRLDGHFSKFFADSPVPTSFLTPQKVKETILEMYSTGFLKIGNSKTKSFTREEMSRIVNTAWKTANFSGPVPKDFFSKVATKLNYYVPPDLTEKRISQARSIAEKFQWERALTEQAFTHFFGVGSSDLHELPQVGYHLDTFTRPGPLPGSFLLQSYKMCGEMLHAIAMNAGELDLTSQDQLLLNDYIAIADQLQEQIGPFLDKAEQALKNAGFIVIPTPGIIYHKNDFLSPQMDKPLNNNFLNAISGYSAKNKRSFYIATGASVGDKLGTILMESYRQFLTSYQKDLAVYFIGYDPNNPTDLSEGMRWWSERKAQAGPHCFSVEIKRQGGRHTT